MPKEGSAFGSLLYSVTVLEGTGQGSWAGARAGSFGTSEEAPSETLGQETRGLEVKW